MYEPGSTNWKKQREAISYTSSSLKTEGKHSWQYGRFVMRGKIDINTGLWPAWWTLSVACGWPAGGEIDIMEFYRGKLLAKLACMRADGKPQWFSNTFYTDSLGKNKWANQFHVWQMDWNENFIILLPDGKVLNKVPLDALVNRNG